MILVVKVGTLVVIWVSMVNVRVFLSMNQFAPLPSPFPQPSIFGNDRTGNDFFFAYQPGMLCQRGKHISRPFAQCAWRNLCNPRMYLLWWLKERFIVNSQLDDNTKLRKILTNSVMLTRSYIAAHSAQLRWILLNNFLSCYWCHPRSAARWSDVNVSICNIWIIVIDAWGGARCRAWCALKNGIFVVNSSEFWWLGTFTTWRWFRSLQW